MKNQSPQQDHSSNKPFDDVLRRMLSTPPAPKKQDNAKIVGKAANKKPAK